MIGEDSKMKIGDKRREKSREDVTREERRKAEERREKSTEK